MDIQCEPGYDGGLSQVFVLEVFTENLDSQEDGEVLYRNMTDRTAPRFSLGKVASGVLYTARMYAANSKGRATPVTLPRFSFPSSENQMGEYSNDIFFFFFTRNTFSFFFHRIDFSIKNNLWSRTETNILPTGKKKHRVEIRIAQNPIPKKRHMSQATSPTNGCHGVQ